MSLSLERRVCISARTRPSLPAPIPVQTSPPSSHHLKVGGHVLVQLALPLSLLRCTPLPRFSEHLIIPEGRGCVAGPPRGERIFLEPSGMHSGFFLFLLFCGSLL